MRKTWMQKRFKRPKALIGMVHVRALPGSPGSQLSMQEIINIAVAEAKTYAKCGYEAVMIENMHDRPYVKYCSDPITTATMTAVAMAVRQAVQLPLGIQVLAGANKEALAAARAVGADFIRAEAFVFAHVAHSGILEACAGELVRYRQAIGGSDIAILADIKKKHASHAITQDVDIVMEANTAKRFLADGVIVSGSETAVPASSDEVARVHHGCDLPLFIGSGINPDNIASYKADGFIVGSWLKEEGLWHQPLSEERVVALRKAFEDLG